MRSPATQLPPRRSEGSLLALVLLLFVEVTFAFVPPSLGLSTLVFFATALLSLYLMIANKRAIPPLLDVGFVFAATFYYGLPGLFYLAYPDREPIPSLPLQQALVGSAIATFHLLRHAARWRSWNALIERKQSPQATVIDWRLTIALLVICALWIGAALPGLSKFMAMQYGTREVAQRSDMTIPLLGFDLLAIVAMALLTERMIQSRNRRTWWLIGVLAFLAYGVLCVLIFGTRTKLVVCLLLPGVSALAVYRLTMRTAVIVALTVIALLPIFDVIGRARFTMHERGASVDTFTEFDVANDLESMLASSEMVAMAPIAEDVMTAYGSEPMYGKYVAWSVVQAPPAFLLRPLGLGEARSLAGRYTREYFPHVWARGGAWGLPLSAESYVNLQELGGVFSGLVLFLFVVAFEKVILARVSFALGLALSADFMIAMARVNRGGLESLAKPIAVSLVMLVVIKACQMVTTSRMFGRFLARPGAS